MSVAPSTPTAEQAHASVRLGLLYGVAAYVIWGFFPLFFPLLEPASALEILAERFIFSLLFMGVILTVTRSWSRLRPALASRRSMLLLAGASLLIATNWGVYIWAVNEGNVVEASLGYFINPLVTVVLGVVVLHERLRRLQWVAVGIACLAVLVLTFGYGHMPWIGLVLALSFGGYGLTKKVVNVDPQASLTIETAYATPVALVYVAHLEMTGALVFGHHSTPTTLLLLSVGVVTAIPLLLFGGAANRVPLTTMGLLQYITPMIQFIIGVAIDGEQMPPARWMGFAIVWVALAVFSYDGLRQGHANRGARREAAAGVEATI
jgi:chloramphenicol-sensitive protein RarD